MYDHPSIMRNGERCCGSRYLRTEALGVYQTLYYRGLSRSDTTAYAGFAPDDRAMNAAAGRLLQEMVAEDDRAAGLG